MTMKVLATKRARPGETTYSETWSCSNSATLSYKEGCALLKDNGAEGTQDQPYYLILPMDDYERVMLIEGD